MRKKIKIRMARRALSIKAWLDAKSVTGSFIMGENGPVTRREVLLVNAITLFLMAGCLSADSSLLVAAVCVIIFGLLVWRLNIVSEKQNKDGKRGICTNQ